MSAPGYYKTNYRALRLREMLRWYGLKNGIRNYLKTRFMSSTSGSWMPGLWVENECKREDLSETFWQAIKLQRSSFEQLGFIECRVSKSKSLSPLIRESGGVFYLDPTGCYFGQLLCHRIYHRSLGREINQIIIGFSAIFERARFTCTNAKKTFDPPDGTEVIRFDSYDVNFIYKKFLEELKQRKEAPRRFPDVESLRQWFDAWQTGAFEERVRRRLFIPMTDQEVAAAQAKLQAGIAGLPPLRPRRFSLRWIVWLFIVSCIISLQFARKNSSRRRISGRPGTMEYQGQEFKMSRPYPTYEDYEDDPNNLDTNELQHIEQVMTSVQAPLSFKNNDELTRFLFDLKFPGYGLSGLHEIAKADDGSRLLVETVEIPQRDKSRALTLRRSGKELKLVDDFVYSTATNQISHVKLEKQILRYYDANNQLIREKQL